MKREQPSPLGAPTGGGILASWTTQQLVSFLGAVSTCRSEGDAVRTAAEAVAAATDAEAGVVVLGGRIVSCIGFGRHEVPVEQLLAVCRGGAEFIEVPGVGTADVCVAQLGGLSDGYLLAARAGEDFGAGERAMINAMANVLTLTLDLLRALGSERSAREVSERTTDQVSELLTKVREQRQLTLDRFSRIQRAIAARSQLQDVLDAITTTACELVECDLAVLRITTADLVSTIGYHAGGHPGAQSPSHRRHGVDPDGIGTLAQRLGQPVVDNAFAVQAEARRYGVPTVRTAVAVPVRHGDRQIGFLMLGSRQEGHEMTHLEQSLAVTLAEHAALAVQDSQTVSALHEALEDAVHKASHDALTGLANRATFLATLERSLARGITGTGPRPCVLYVDLDYFKVVNDTYGHQVGDELLSVTAARLQSGVRADDLVARLGGDEFAVLLGSVTDEDQAERLADRLHHEVSKPVQLASQRFYPSASIGVAPAVTDDLPAALLNRADLALYEAKRRGRGQVTRYDMSLENSATPSRRLTSPPPVPAPRNRAAGTL